MATSLTFIPYPLSFILSPDPLSFILQPFVLSQACPRGRLGQTSGFTCSTYSRFWAEKRINFQKTLLHVCYKSKAAFSTPSAVPNSDFSIINSAFCTVHCERRINHSACATDSTNLHRCKAFFAPCARLQEPRISQARPPFCFSVRRIKEKARSKSWPSDVRLDRSYADPQDRRLGRCLNICERL